MSIPTAEQINVHGSLDERVAVEHFFSKSLTDAEAMFKENALYYLTDLMWMGVSAFQYYVVAALNYLRSESARGDSDAVNVFSEVLRFRLCVLKENVDPVVPALRPGLEDIIEKWEVYGVSPAIYGDLKYRYQLILDTICANG